MLRRGLFCGVSILRAGLTRGLRSMGVLCMSGLPTDGCTRETPGRVTGNGRMCPNRALPAGVAVIGNVIAFGSPNGDVTAVNRSTGARIWSFSGTEAVRSEVSSDGRRIFSAHEETGPCQRAVSGRRVVGVGIQGRRHEIYGGTFVSDGLVYFASYDDWVYALSALETGEMVWRSELLRASLSTPNIERRSAVRGFLGRARVRARRADGRLAWNFWTGDSVVASVAASGDSAFFGADDGYLYSVAASDGSLNWRYQIGDRIRTTPALDGGLVYVGANDDFVYALDAETGSLVWKFETRNDVQAPIAVHDGIVYAGLPRRQLLRARRRLPG